MFQGEALNLRTGLVGGLIAITASIAFAVSDAEVKLVYDAVRSKYPDATYCALSDEARRNAVVQETMRLASSRSLEDPYGAGPAAGVQLRALCGVASAAIDPSNLRWLTTAKPLHFEVQPRKLSWSTSPRDLANQLFVPEGDGKFPVVVVGQTKSISEHLLVHAKELLEAGFAVLVVDTYGPRGYKTGVNEPLPAEFAKDSYDALASLQGLSMIERNRIFQTGYSNGALAAALLASPEGANKLGAAGRFRATVANYGACKMASPYAGANAKATSVDMLSKDSDKPILMLMGELDIETPPSTCFPLLQQMKAAGKDVSWHIYPQTTHGWDKSENNGFVYRTTSGETMTYRYDADVSKDATQRMIKFFNQYK
jgi:dienelactone hydrolase